MAHVHDLRYGVFLRPDAATCWTVTQLTVALERQFGLRSAGAFPPHATLAGNVATDADAADLVRALTPVFHETKPFPIVNAGLVRTGGFVYDIDRDATGRARNAPLADVAARVRTALLPLSRPVADTLVTPLADARFSGHIGVASHELLVDARLGDEVADFLATIPIPAPPPRFDARWFSLFAFRADWAGPWWEALSWRHLRSWDVLLGR